MAYTVLARKYRSQRFDDIIGQEPITQTLRNAIRTDRVAHAYLFAGTRGVGKTTTARVLSKALNCLSVNAPTVEPCCRCDSCVAINIGEDIDVIEIDGATNNGVDQVRQLRQNAIYRPARSRFKIYIIDEVHMLSTGAFNALLKILEEPPSHVKFIFATTEPNKVIATIQSRCQRFDFGNISPNLIAGQLKSILEQEKIEGEEDLILSLAKMANGSMRDGLSLLDRLISTGVEPLTAELLEEFLGCPNSEKIHTLVSKIGNSDAAGTLSATEQLINTGLSEVQIVDSLVDYMRDLMVVKSAGVDTELLILTAEQRKQVGELAEDFDTAALIYNITALERLRWMIKNSDKSRALLEASLLRFALSEHFLNADELLSQLRSGSNGAVKKNESRGVKADRGNKARRYKDAEPQSSEQQTTSDKTQDSYLINDIESIKKNWQSILKTIAGKLGNGTGGLLSSAVPTGFENGILTLSFPASAEMARKMCASNGRAESIRSLLGEYYQADVGLKFDIAADETPQAEPAPSQPKASSQKRNVLINDPAVKTVLMGLGATITGIEEEK